MPHPAWFVAAVRDRRLHGLPLAVLGYCWTELSHERWMGLKESQAAHALGVTPRGFRKAMGRLVCLGYLERGPLAGDVGRWVRTYRLLPPARVPTRNDSSPVRPAA